MNTKIKSKTNEIKKSPINRKRILTIVLSVVAFIILGLLSGVVYYYVTYGELPTLTDSSAGNIKCKTNQILQCDKNKKGKEVCKCINTSKKEGRDVSGNQLCGCDKYDSNGKCVRNPRYWQTAAVKQCKCYKSGDNSYWGMCINPPAGVTKSEDGCKIINDVVCKTITENNSGENNGTVAIPK